MRTQIVLPVMLSSALLLTACQTTKRLAQVDRETICLALERADPLTGLTDEDKRIVRELFTREGKDALKMARALRKEIQCAF
jgi:uncharacterized protein YcfL